MTCEVATMFLFVLFLFVVVVILVGGPWFIFESSWLEPLLVWIWGCEFQDRIHAILENSRALQIGVYCEISVVGEYFHK